VKQSEKNRKALFKSIRTIICHLQVVLGTHSSKNATKGHNQCVDLTGNHNVSSLDISCPAVPRQRSCSTSGFTRSPCDASWIRDELTPLLPKSVTAARCSRCTWETPKPTPSPTPSPTPAPTPSTTPSPPQLTAVFSRGCVKNIQQAVTRRIDVHCRKNAFSCGSGRHQVDDAMCQLNAELTQVRACFVDRCWTKNAWTCSAWGKESTYFGWANIVCKLSP